MSGIREIALWALFTQMNEDDEKPLYSCSLRSRTIALNDIASAFWRRRAPLCLPAFKIWMPIKYRR